MLELLSLGRWRDLAIALLLFVEWTHLKHEEHSFFAVQKSHCEKCGRVRHAAVKSHPTNVRRGEDCGRECQH